MCRLDCHVVKSVAGAVRSSFGEFESSLEGFGECTMYASSGAQRDSSVVNFPSGFLEEFF